MKSLYEMFEKDIVSLEEFLQNCKGMTTNEIQEKRKYIWEVLMPRIKDEAKLRVYIGSYKNFEDLTCDRYRAGKLYGNLCYYNDDIRHTLYEYNYILNKLSAINQKCMEIYNELIKRKLEENAEEVE